jgi:hypothetical protein
MPPKALITGASSGIGRAFAEALARGGYDLTLVARRTRKLEDLVNRLGPGRHRILAADLTQPGDLHGICEIIGSVHYDLLINNAGAGIYKPFRDMPWSDIEAITRLNCDAVTKLSHAYLGSATAGDALINVASIVGFTPYPPAAVYGATKAFVLSLSESLWYQAREHGIYVMALCPGATDTEFFEAAGATREDRPARKYMQSPEAVVAAALRALRKRRKPTVIPGWHNTLFQVLMRLLSREALVRAVGKYAKRQK